MPDLDEDAGLHDRVAMVVVTLAFGLAIGGLFEIWEWFSNTLLGTEMFVTYGDSIGDLIDDALGALAGGLILLVWTGRGWRTWRAPGAALRGEEPMPPAPSKRDSDALTRIGDWLARVRPPRGHEHEEARPYPTLPRWIAGDWGAVIRDPVDIVRLSLVAGVLIALVQGDVDHALRFLAGLVFSLVIRWAEAPRPFDTAFALAMAFQAWGAFAGAYDSVEGYEVAARIFSSAAFAAGFYSSSSASAWCPTCRTGPTSMSVRGCCSPPPALASAPRCSAVGAWAANGLFDAESLTFDQLIANISISFFASLAGAFFFSHLGPPRLAHPPRPRLDAGQGEAGLGPQIDRVAGDPEPLPLVVDQPSLQPVAALLANRQLEPIAFGLLHGHPVPNQPKPRGPRQRCPKRPVTRIRLRPHRHDAVVALGPEAKAASPGPRPSNERIAAPLGTAPGLHPRR